jgi:hypothetical protein
MNKQKFKFKSFSFIVFNIQKQNRFYDQVTVLTQLFVALIKSVQRIGNTNHWKHNNTKLARTLHRVRVQYKFHIALDKG